MRRRWWPRDHVLVSVPVLILVSLAFTVAWSFIRPAPPRRFVIATGRPDGAYYQIALQYRDRLARDGIAVEVRATGGSIDNLRLLDDPASGVDVAFVQGGVLGPSPPPDLLALGTLYVEPLWLFARAPLRGPDLGALVGKRLAVGPEGSGTRVLAQRLLAANGVGGGPTEMLPSTGLDAVQALERGTVDAVFLVAAPHSPSVRAALHTPGVILLSFPRADAHTRLFPFLRKVVLPEGALDLPGNVPPADTVMLGTAANLIIRRDFHPALANLLLVAAGALHGAPGLFESARQFPSPDGVDVPLSDEARRYYQSGPPLLIRYLPFWAATLADRLKILLLPLIAVLLPLFRSLPPLYRWRVRSRIYRWYRDLDEVDRALGEGPPTGDLASLRLALDRIEDEVRHVVVPPSYREEHYHLRLHIEFVRSKVAAALGPAASPAGGLTESSRTGERTEGGHS